jgi:hypothetical protein
MIPKVAMPRLDIEAFVSAIEGLGLRLSATPLADGKVRLNRWRMPDAVLNTQKIEDLWAARIGDDQAADCRTRSTCDAANRSGAPLGASGWQR